MSTTTFAGLGVSESVGAALAARGIETPFPVQSLVLPVALSGRDVLVRSPTGSGKTLAFGLPLVEGVEPGGARPAGLVLAPTRELAVQIERELAPLARARGLSMAVCYGGVGIDAQARKAERADLLVATPGRLADLVGRRRVSLAHIRTLVVDEADRMLDMGFLPQVRQLVRMLPRERRTMFFSATLDGEVGRLADEMSRDAARLRVDAPEGGERLSALLDQSFVACEREDRVATLVGLLTEEPGLALVFCRTRRGADRLSTRLSREGLPAAAMHGDLSQPARERTLRRFADGSARVLVATDVAARGIDLDDIALVVNYDPPDGRDAYTHRVGRTARAGRAGRAITLVMPDDADAVGRIATGLGLEDDWAATGHALPAPRVLYGSRRRGSPFSPAPRKPRGPAAPASGAPRSNRVKRGTRVRPRTA